MNRENIAWCAGVFEGEGHGRLQKDNRNPFSIHFYPHIEIDNTDESILKEFQRVVGLGSVTGPHIIKKKDGYIRKPRFRYSVTCKNAYMVAQLLLPFVISDYKRNQLLKIINKYDRKF